jgi:CheY-like chemotaxis protein
MTRYASVDIGRARGMPLGQITGTTRQDLPRMVVLDEDPDFVDLLRDIFAGRLEVVAGDHRSVNGLADLEPDVIFMDLHPGDPAGLTGWDLTALARRHRDLSRVPILLCTSQNIALDTDGGRLAGLPDVHLLTMPFDVEVLERLVARMLART